ncbi:MAG TPA: citryl-CoA lyase [Micropepsaceae bacterium]|jgi:citrate synthase|nr:citryl-CoA lyase [Micropepsaceae bacterium]
MDDSERANGLSLEAVTDWWESEITAIARGSIRVRGYAIEDLIGRISFPAMIWLMVRGELPSMRQADLLGAILVAGVDHGPQAPSIAIARMAITCGIGLNGAMASAVNALGDVHGGAGQQCMELLADIHRRETGGMALEDAVAAGIDAFRASHGRFIPGFGHRFHPMDPRAQRLADLIREAAKDGAVNGHYLAIGEAVQLRLSKGRSVPLPMNVDGITAIMLLELGFPAEMGRGIFILSRSVGICAHAYEQSQRGERIKGPTPPQFGFRYTGVPPRDVPDGV